jgi:hypothetical protein
MQGFDIRKEVLEVIQETEPDIIRFNQAQIFAGQLKTGEPITNLKTGYVQPYAYSVWWGEHRMDLGLQVDHYDFKVTGEFFNTMLIANLDINSFDITSFGASENKFDNLKKLFGEEFMGLSQESRAEYVKKNFFPNLKARIETKTGLKLT